MVARISGRVVAARFPARGPVRALLVGEAPGPRGADQSGIPFWGDRSGRLVYRALASLGWAEVPEEAWSLWDGAKLTARGLEPRLSRVALSNALPQCPTDDGHTFRAPTRAELFAAPNRARMAKELARAARRAPEPLVVVALGRKAESLLAALADVAPFTLHYLPHPSARVLARSGAGATMAERERAWQAELVAILGARSAAEVPPRSH